MNKKNTVVLKVKGLHTPRLLLWAKGVMDKLLHTGGLDPNTGELTSSYITGQISRFESACEKCFAEADDKLKPVWVEVDKLLVDYAQLSGVSGESTDDADNTTNARAREKAAKVKAANEAARVAIVKRLSELGNLVLAEVFQVDEAITSTSKHLASAFTAYGHGLTWKPVYKHMIPTINTVDNYCADKLCDLHDVTWKTMISIVKEELKNDVV